MSILRGPVGLDECPGVLEELRGYLGQFKQNIWVQTFQNRSGGSEVSGASKGG